MVNIFKGLFYRCKVYLKHTYITLLIVFRPLRHYFAVNRIKRKQTIKVVFFATHSSNWKYDYLYRLMDAHERFYPLVLVCPVVNHGIDNMSSEIDKCYSFFQSKNFNVVKAYNKYTNEYLDVKKDITPDLIFYTSPYREVIDSRYYIFNFLGTLTCYVPYNFGNSLDYDMFHNLPFHNLLWRIFAETGEHKGYSIKHAINKGRNVFVSGYPGVDAFVDRQKVPVDVWKVKNSNLKKIIWAPHHSIFPNNNSVYYSCFLQYYDFMLDLALKYKSFIQIAFKPHPLLKANLDKLWGKDAADDYYQKWDSYENTFYVDGAYEDLFLTSDAMIHDSGSFLIEYMFVNKPVMRTFNDQNVNEQLNPFAIKCLENYYKAYNKSDIEIFINNVILNKDILKYKRTLFLDELMTLYQPTASNNILVEILNSLT